MILELSNLLGCAVQETLEDKVAVSFSGGIDSTIIAAIAKRHAEVELFSAGVPGSPDLEYAEQAAARLGLPLNKILIDEPSAMGAYEGVYRQLPLDFLKVEILVPVSIIAREAKAKGHSVLLFGSAAEELFAGYERYYSYHEEGKDLSKILKDEFRTLPQRDIGWIKKVCRKQGIEARFPYYNKEISKLMFSVPIEERLDDRELKKGILREAGKIIGVPDIILQRRKKAMQYGSGVHKMLMKKVDEINSSYPSPELPSRHLK
jgi:asparagine synthase (glutamine-hydrolysing)